ncbi:hypothetical protein HDU97_007294 [Phlyctochytrium planicorne]|nr:hypothetical protein HDU97_007294 [Phlyctochytrium planicorne]
MQQTASAVSVAASAAAVGAGAGALIVNNGNHSRSAVSFLLSRLRIHHFVLLPMTIISGVALFEQFRWWWNKSHRRRVVRGHWEEIDIHDKEAGTDTAKIPRRKRKKKLQRVKQRAKAAATKAALALAADATTPADIMKMVTTSHLPPSAFPISPPASPVNQAKAVITDDELSTDSLRSIASSTSFSDQTDNSSDNALPVIRKPSMKTADSVSSQFRQKLFHSLVVVGRFVNPWLEWEDRNVGDFLGYLGWQLTRTCRNGVPKDRTILDQDHPVVEPDYELWAEFHIKAKIAAKRADPNPPLMSFTWFGQSTCLVQMDGYNILTDPIFSSRTVGEWVGPRRVQKVPCALEDLPRIDIVLVSHNHYDHLDLAVVRKLENSVTWYIPRGLKKWFASLGVFNVVELDWWEETRHKDTESESGRPEIEIVGAPIQHWSGRHFLDVNSTLWSSFLVKGPSGSFYHCGDTGYCSAFKEIGRRYGPVTLSAIPIGSYEPREYMKHQHIDPSEAVQIHEDLGCRHSVGVHWGTFMMSDEHYLEPPALFENEGVRRKLPKGSIMATTLGESIVIRGGKKGKTSVDRGKGAREWRIGEEVQIATACEH